MALFDRPDDKIFCFDLNSKELLRYGSTPVLRFKLTELFLAEHELRELTQREEYLHHKVMALEKAMAIESDGRSDGTQLQNTKTQLERTQLQYPRKEYALYKAEYNFHSEVKERYDSLRRDANWYMREEMVQDCSDRGGCCSRECGCCEQRHLSKRKKGRGHCTVECGCCIGFRGFELPDKQKQEMSKDFETTVKEHNSACALYLANCFFCPLESKLQLSRWQRMKGVLTPKKK